MIPTPEQALNPKGFTELDALNAEDGIPVEQGSGFGGFIKRGPLISSIVKAYVEVSASAVIDLSSRVSDLFIRVTGGSSPDITIVGALPSGRCLMVDARAVTADFTLEIGADTYTIAQKEGVVVFHATADGWARPSEWMYDLTVKNDLRVDGSVSSSGDLAFDGDLVIDGSITPRSEFTQGSITLAHLTGADLPRGALSVEWYPTIGNDSCLMVRFDPDTIFTPILSKSGASQGATFIMNDGARHKIINNSGSTKTFRYLII